MKFSKISSIQSHMLQAHIVSVETDIARGLHSFSIVGLASKAVEEARDRVSAAIKNSGFASPKQTNAKIVVSLAPADIKKEGPAFDLPIALGYLLAAGEIDFDPEGKLFVGELSLDGALQPIRGALSFARKGRAKGFREIYVPKENESEAALESSIAVYGVSTLKEAIDHVAAGRKILRAKPPDMSRANGSQACASDLDDVVGQEKAKRGLVIAAAGRHNIALFGPPGTGKTMLARALPSIMPALSFPEMLEVTEIHSAAGALPLGSIEGLPLVSQPPVRSPHHTASYTALVGGGSVPRPGEVTLAHRGVLFLDEFPEFDARVLEALRQPLEDRCISISRSGGNARFPADFILIAALNPCPCGNKGIEGKECRCAPKDVLAYDRRISGPIVDRIDMWIEVSKVDYRGLLEGRGDRNETGPARAAVLQAREIQIKRYEALGIPARSNSAVAGRDLERSAFLSSEAKSVLNKAAGAYGLSGRGYHRVVRLARTIADLAGAKDIGKEHILEALQYRQRKLSND